jgi:hypothetical protein
MPRQALTYAEGATMRNPVKKLTYASVLLCLLAAAAGVTAYTAARRRQEPPKVFVPKRFISEVKKLKVESHWVENEGTPRASLHVVIRNKSDLAVTKVSVTIADLTVSSDGGYNHDEPVAVVEPYGTEEFSIPLTNFIDDSPLVISAAIYADGTEEGRKVLLKEARKTWKERRAERAAKKGGPEQ